MSKAPSSLLEQIKQDILASHWPAEKALKQTELSTHYGVSRIPIRDALLQLKNEGWLVAAGKASIKIPQLNPEAAEDLYRMRMLLEPLLLQHALSNINHAILGQARDILAEIDQGNALNAQQHGKLNWQFHALLYQAANRPTLFATVDNLHTQFRRYIGYHTIRLDYRDISQQEHYHMLELIRDKHRSQAVALLTRHIESAGCKLTDYLKQHSLQIGL